MDTLEFAIQKEKMTEKFIHRICPVCGSKNFGPKDIISQPDAVSLSLEDLKSCWYGFFKKKVFFSYSRCQKCRVLFCKDYFSPEQLSELYKQMPANMAEVSEGNIHKTQKGYFDVLKSFPMVKGGYMEVGPDIGLFTHHCVQQKIFDNFFLFEPNRAVHDRLVNVLEGSQYQISSEMFDYKIVPDHSISVVAMIHLLDHVLNPKELLSKIREKMLGTGSILLLVTHDESSLLAQIIKSKWPAYCLQHPQLYSPLSLKRLLNDTGFKVRKTVKSYNYFPFIFLAKHLLWAMGIEKISLPNIPSISVPLKLGNIITVASPNSNLS